MKSVKFIDGNISKDSYEDWNLILKPKSRPLASPKITTIDIEGKDGSLDLTTSLTGDVKYKNVSYSIEFTLMNNREDWEEKLQEITTFLHGKRMKVIFTEDPDWYYVGRMTLDGITNKQNVGSIKVTCDFEPYKLKVEETIINESIEAGKVITLSNSRKWVMPVIESISKNLYNYEDVNTVDNEVATDEEGWITIAFDNSGKTSIKYLNYWTNNLNLRTSKKYAIVVEIKEVMGNGSLYVISGNENSQIVENSRFLFSSLTSNSKKIILATTKENFNISNVGLRTYVDFRANESGSITFRLSVLEDINITEDEFVYEPFVDAYANFDYEGNTYSVNGTLKTPGIILKEGNSKITLTNGVGNIRISYREGKL